MRTRTVGVVVLLGVVLVGLLSQRVSKAPGLTAQDYAEIQQLYARYAHGIDAKIDDGRPRGALSRSRIGCRSTSPMTRRCEFLTKPSIKHSMFKGAVRFAGN